MDIGNTQWDFYANGEKGVLNIKNEVEKDRWTGDLSGTSVLISWDEASKRISFAREVVPGHKKEAVPLVLQFYTGSLAYDGPPAIASGIFDQISYLPLNHGKSTHSWAAIQIPPIL